MRKYQLVFVALAMIFATACDPTENENQDKGPVNSVVLNKFELTLEPGQSETLVASVMPDNATDKTVTWSSSAEDVASVNSEGKVEAKKEGIAIITAKAGEKEDKCKVIVNEPEQPVTVPDAIDLGLSVKWASLNIGASKPEDCGEYYAWGETETKEFYSREAYKWANLSMPQIDIYGKTAYSLTKYCSKSAQSFYWGGEGEPDNKTVLEPEDDVANVLLGGNWRIPTRAEMLELKDLCTWTWDEPKKGFLVTGPNGNSIFLPAAGKKIDDPNRMFTGLGATGDYWSSSLVTDAPCFAYDLYFLVSEGRTDMLTIGVVNDRNYGFSVRPVSD